LRRKKTFSALEALRDALYKPITTILLGYYYYFVADHLGYVKRR